MKQLLTLSMGLLLAVFTFAQAPQQISYQAVIRDAAGDPLTNSALNLRFTVREATAGGAMVYQEVHAITTNDYGLVSLKAGTGTSQIGIMTDIEWENYSYFLEVEQDSGAGYVVMGTSQMLSVPYALYANEATTLHDNTLDGTGTSSDSLRLAQQGATVGEVLLWDGITWTPGSTCVTLDDAYDCNTPGEGRIITVDSEPVLLDAYGNTALEVIPDTNDDAIQLQSVVNGDGLDVSVSGVGDAVHIVHTSLGDGVEITHSGTGEGIEIDHTGPGDGINIVHSGNSQGIDVTKNTIGRAIQVNQNAADNGISVVQAANGNAGNFTQVANVASSCVVVNGFNTAAAINATQFGAGDGILSTIANPANASNALDVATNGMGKAAAIFQSNPGNVSNVLEAVNSGNGVVGEFNQTKPTAPSPTIHAATSGMGPVGVFEQTNPANGAMAIMATNEGTGHVMKLDQLHPMTMSPALVVTHAGLGSAGRFEAMNFDNNEPTVDVFNLGDGHAILIESADPFSDDYAAKVISHNAGGGLHVDGDSPFTTTLASFEHSAAARVAHFDQTTGGSPITKEVVLISTTNMDEDIPALKVTTPDPTTNYAAEFNGFVDITGGITADGPATFNEGALITGDLLVTGLSGLASVEASDLLVFGETALTGDAIAFGNLDVFGNLSAGTVSASVKMFSIDHPLDPENKLLQHACIESSEMMNLYSGNVVLNQNGEATIELPAWFEALNTDARYQLTCVGGFANVFIKEKLSGNRFVIGGGFEGLEVSWQLTAVRHDKFALDNPLQVEKDKEVKR